MVDVLPPPKPMPKGVDATPENPGHAHHDVPGALWHAAYNDLTPGAKGADVARAQDVQRINDSTTHAADIARAAKDVAAGKFSPETAKFFADLYAESIQRNNGDLKKVYDDLHNAGVAINQQLDAQGSKNQINLNPAIRGNKVEFWYTIAGPGIDTGAQEATIQNGSKDSDTAVEAGGILVVKKPNSQPI